MQTGSLMAMALLLLSAFAITTMAADSATMNPSLTVASAVPVITGMAVGAASYDPTESANTTITVTLNVSDANGVADLDDSKVSIYVDDAATFATAVGKYTRLCTPTANLSATVRSYTCQTDLEFYDAAGTYSTNLTAGDQATDIWNNTGTNAPTFTWTTLVAATVDDAGITFGTVSLGVENQTAAENPTTVTNTGNADLYFNITGADLTGATYTFEIGNFSVSLDATPTAEMVLTTGTQQIIVGGTNASVSAGASTTEDLYWYVDVPATMLPDAYSASWVLGMYQQ